MSRLAQHFNRPLDSLPRVGGGCGSSSFPGPSFQQQLRVVQSCSSGGFMPSSCHKCGEPLTRKDAEEHHLSEHAGKFFCDTAVIDINKISSFIYFPKRRS